MNATTDFSRLWNGTEPGWVVVRHVEDRETLAVHFTSCTPSIPEVKALRTVAPARLGNPAAEVLASLKGKSVFSLGELESNAARRLREQCEAVGLQVVGQGHQAVRYRIINELTKVALLIENAATNRAVAEEAIKRGVPVRHSTV